MATVDTTEMRFRCTYGGPAPFGMSRDTCSEFIGLSVALDFIHPDQAETLLLLEVGDRVMDADGDLWERIK